MEKTRPSSGSGPFVCAHSTQIGGASQTLHADSSLSPGRPAVRGFLFPLRLNLGHHDLVPLRSGYLEFFDGGFDRIIVVFSLDDTEVLVLCAKLDTSTIHLTPQSSASRTETDRL